MLYTLQVWIIFFSFFYGADEAHGKLSAANESHCLSGSVYLVGKLGIWDGISVDSCYSALAIRNLSPGVLVEWNL
jgi:hypothetical protein